MTITVAQMIEALQALPQDAELVVTESGYYCYGEFAKIMLPEPLHTGHRRDCAHGHVPHRSQPSKLLRSRYVKRTYTNRLLQRTSWWSI